MEWQFYWPGWWRLWPHHHKLLGEFGGCEFYDHVFSFGPLQFRWRTQI